MVIRDGGRVPHDDGRRHSPPSMRQNATSRTPRSAGSFASNAAQISRGTAPSKRNRIALTVDAEINESCASIASNRFAVAGETRSESSSRKTSRRYARLRRELVSSTGTETSAGEADQCTMNTTEQIATRALAVLPRG